MENSSSPKLGVLPTTEGYIELDPVTTGHLLLLSSLFNQTVEAITDTFAKATQLQKSRGDIVKSAA